MPDNKEVAECDDCGIEIEAESVKVNDKYLCSYCLGEFMQVHGIAVLQE